MSIRNLIILRGVVSRYSYEVTCWHSVIIAIAIVVLINAFTVPCFVPIYCKLRKQHTRNKTNCFVCLSLLFRWQYDLPQILIYDFLSYESTTDILPSPFLVGDTSIFPHSITHTHTQSEFQKVTPKRLSCSLNQLHTFSRSCLIVTRRAPIKTALKAFPGKPVERSARHSSPVPKGRQTNLASGQSVNNGGNFSSQSRRESARRMGSRARGRAQLWNIIIHIYCRR